MKIYFVTANEKKIAESDERLKRFVERVQTQEQVRLAKSAPSRSTSMSS